VRELGSKPAEAGTAEQAATPPKIPVLRATVASWQREKQREKPETPPKLPLPQPLRPKLRFNKGAK
jgi:hypothetical protein